MANSHKWDVIIVGARVAGAGLAIRFARSGRRVLCIERSPLGSDTLSSHGFGGMAITQFIRLGLMDDILATGAPRLANFRLDFDGQAIEMPIANELGFTLSVRRTALDPIFVRHAVQAGATVRHGIAARALLHEDGRVVGVTIERADGTREDHRARLVVGADGRHSAVASWVGATPYNAAGTPACAIYGYYENFAPPSAAGDALQFVSGEGVDAVCGPSDGGVAAVLMIYEPEQFEVVRQGGVAAFEESARSVPVLGDQLRSARLVSKLRPAGTRELDCHFRVPYGSGWALVGDAGYKEHPAAGRGIGNALRSGELLHRAVEDAWNGGKEADVCLPRYQEQRDAHMRHSFDFSLMQASVNPMSGGKLAQIATAAAALTALDAAAT